MHHECKTENSNNFRYRPFTVDSGRSLTLGTQFGLDYYLMYTAPDSSEVWCWNLRQYCVVMKIQTKDMSTGATKPKGSTTDTDTTTASSETKSYHLYISLN